jgi:hypothetical protein
MVKVHLGWLRGRKGPPVVSALHYLRLSALARNGHFDSATLTEIYRVSRPTWPASLPGQPRWFYEPPEPADGSPTQPGK